MEQPVNGAWAITPRERAERFAIQFRGQANHLAFQFGGPVYLVGSYLTAEIPGDVDIRCLITREDADLLFGRDSDGAGIEWTPGSFARCREELKQSRRMTRRWRIGDLIRQRIDFQFQIVLLGDNGDPIPGTPDQEARPRIRLDAVPNDMLRAGLGNP